jgi:DNA-binding CsgD family transcriptional regulator
MMETQRALVDAEESAHSADDEDRAIRQLDQAMQMLRTLLELHPQAAAIADAKGNWVFANRAFGSLFGVSTSLRSLAATWRTHFSGPLRTDEATFWSGLSAERPGIDLRFGMRKQDGTQACFLAHGTLLERKLDGNYIIGWTFFETWNQPRKSHSSPATGDSHAYPPESSPASAGSSEKASTSHTRPPHRDCLNCVEQSREALRLLMQHAGEQKRDLEQRIAENYLLTVFPLIAHLKSMNLPASQAYLLETLEFNLRHINSVFHINVPTASTRLSGREIEICQLIRAGKDSRQIAEALGVKLQTVMVHRKHIRRKLDLRNNGVRLSAFLQKGLGALW